MYRAKSADGCDRSCRTKPGLTTGIEDLAAGLRAHAKGLFCAEAAVELLIGHRLWLCREEFVGHFVEVAADLAGGGVLAFVEWRAAVTALDAGRLPCSDSEGQMLRIAASVAEGVPVDLCGALTGLDATNIVLVTQAVRHAGGHRPAGAVRR